MGNTTSANIQPDPALVAYAPGRILVHPKPGLGN